MMESPSHKGGSPRTEADPQNETAVSVKVSELSVCSLVPLVVMSLVLSGGGAVMASYANGGQKYLYFLQLPWIAGAFQVLVFTCGAELLERRLSLWEMGLEVLGKVVLSGVCCSLLVYGYKIVENDYPFWMLFAGLEVAAMIALLPVQSCKHLWKRAIAALTLSIPLLQLYYSLTYGTVLGGLAWNQSYKVWLCYSYPVVIGLIKTSMKSER